MTATQKSDAATTAKATAWSHGHSSHGTAPQSDGHGTAWQTHGHGHDRHGHDGHDHARPRHTCNCANKGTHPRDTTRHVNRTNIRANRRSIEHMYQCCAYDKPPGRGVSPWSKSRGRWLSSADAECSLEHFWITRYLRSLHIFSGCNRFCTLHIVYTVPWIDVDGGRAQLGSASISGCYHSLRVA